MMHISGDNDEHRRCVAACGVQGVYALEDDQTERRARAWWESFHFRKREVLKFRCECVLCRTNILNFGSNNSSCCTYGAILEHAPPPGAGARRHPSAPRYIVAFRGTLTRHATIFADMHLNLKILVNRQHACGRFGHARDAVGSLLRSIAATTAGGKRSDVWLAGHSLGASIALDVGRDMARGGCYVPTFLFNPPQVSLAPGMLPPVLNRVAKGVIYPTSYAVKAALGKTVMRSLERDMEELFEKLAPWVPEIYVHEKDVICRGFIDYFEQRQKMLDRFRRVAKVGMKLSFRDMHVHIHSSNPANGEDLRGRPHLLPSARLWKNSSGDDPHGLLQWWQPDSKLKLIPTRYSCHGS
ncbi:hypothetical protein EJB05_12188, partial [Eragrostis curvula]